MFRRIALLLIVSVLFISVSITGATSCPSFGIEDLSEVDILAKVNIIETDDTGYNAIVQVHEYYKGSGDEYLTIMRNLPALESIVRRGYTSGCAYHYGSPLYGNTEMYIGLRPNEDGTYTDYLDTTVHFYAEDGQLTYQGRTIEGLASVLDNPLAITENELIDLMLEVGERDTPLVPTPNHYPLPRFLNITTEDGTRYQLNPDRSISLIADDTLIAQSPDGAHLALRENDTSIVLRPAYSAFHSVDFTIIGQHAKFTNDSNFVAVWDDMKLSLHAFTNSEQDQYGRTIIGLHTLVELDADNITNLVWSANSSTLVWQEDSAIYHWNINEHATPTRLDIDIEQVALSEISTYGRYVKVMLQARNWLWYDTQTNVVIRGHTLISFDEQYFITAAFNPDADDSSCSLPLQTNCSISTLSVPPVIPDFAFQMDNTLYTIGCGEPPICYLDRTLLEPYVLSNSYYNSTFIPIIPVTALAYDQSYGVIALVSNDHEIHFDLLDDADYVDLADELDSPITSVSWGQPTFYDYDIMNQTLYLPND